MGTGRFGGGKEAFGAETPQISRKINGFLGRRGDFGQAGAMGKTLSRMSTLNGSRSMLSRGGSGTSAAHFHPF